MGRSKVWKELGNVPEDRETTQRIKQQLSLEATVDDDSLSTALKLLKTTETGEYIIGKEVFRLLSDLERLGIVTKEDYRGLRSKQLYGVLMDVKARLIRQAYERGLGLEETAA